MKERFDTLSAICSRETTRHYSTSFSLGILFLKKEVRDPIHAIYGFVRLADEIVDSFHGYPKSLMLAELKRDCFMAIERGISINPVINSFQQVVNKFGIRHDLINQFLNSMEMDLHDQSYTAEKYEEYIMGSAQVVGLMCLHVFINGKDEEFERLRIPAMKLGSAFQKVNFLRDINADYQELNRTYFPGVNLSAFSEENKRAIEADILRELNEALNGIRLLPCSCRKGVYLAYVYYRQLFRKITKIPAEKVMSQRIRVSNGHKFLLMFDSLVRYKLNVL
ncbi:phytoene/squalene synthase family protein [Mucilaginibacter gotjawali]|uniref:Phytoene/squalene synthetase n=2 Tax=Mucilaginibacter gotjawali TaxID=1550579 RepID=A0A839SM35_9SPHI|nr:phytoene/squalene synthase family protein [Mucilaginibacter gotjawali]MBB3058438.1 phytoene/squalene synthetase [Mucilaginibacter gotjawali]BAU53733.1 15-cis-phytoene synthase [Mucilaginibacter gotjawali]